MQPDKIVTPGSYVDFLHYLDTVTTEEELFSRLTYWFANRNTADDVRDRFDVVEDRAKELKLWNGLDLKLERWARANKEELARIGKDAFGALICADYAAYQEGGQAQQGNAQPLKVHSARELAEMLIPPIRYIVDELVPVGLGVLVAKPKIFAKSQKNQPGAVAVVSTGAPHGSMSQLKEPDGAQFFKPSGTY